MNWELIKEMIEQKYIDVQKHPTADLYIYNYSKSCQFEKKWNEATIMCRGLICDGHGNIVARCFPKFWNYEEIEDKTTIPNLSFEAYEKLDGSLGIMYWVNGNPYIATRGSFTSWQCIEATKILWKQYGDNFHLLDQSKTYLFEIILANDHHCISYGDTNDIFLLAVIDTQTGEEDEIYNWEHIFKCTKRYDGVTDYLTIRDMFSGDNREGFVIKFSNGYRMKMKYEEYFKIHFLRSTVNERLIFDIVVNDRFDEYYDSVSQLDEENQIMFYRIAADFIDKYNQIDFQTTRDVEEIVQKNLNGQELVNYVKKYKYSDIIFRKMNEGYYAISIWRYINKECNLKLNRYRK